MTSSDQGSSNKLQRYKSSVRHRVAVLVLWTVLCCYQQQICLSESMHESFMDNFHSSWGKENLKTLYGGQTVQLSLNQNSGSGFVSNNHYLYGFFGMHLKLVPRNSAGTVTSFYLSSKVDGARDVHDEVDFEFLGNVSGEPYILQTNVFIGGVGGREQRMYLWFDPTTDYHWYSIAWNPKGIVFWVDDIPIRRFKNNTDVGVPYLSKRPMALYSSIFDASDWATRGGLVGIDWSKAPFASSYKDFTVMGCKVDKTVNVINPQDETCNYSFSSGSPSRKSESYGQYNSRHSLEATRFSSDFHRRSSIKRVRKDLLIYDYCRDFRRYPSQPAECPRNA